MTDRTPSSNLVLGGGVLQYLNHRLWDFFSAAKLSLALFNRNKSFRKSFPRLFRSSIVFHTSSRPRNYRNSRTKSCGTKQNGQNGPSKPGKSPKSPTTTRGNHANEPKVTGGEGRRTSRGIPIFWHFNLKEIIFMWPLSFYCWSRLLLWPRWAPFRVTMSRRPPDDPKGLQATSTSTLVHDLLICVDHVTNGHGWRFSIGRKR